MKNSWQCLPWQERQWQLMLHGMQAGVLAHSYLFRGVPGVGKLRFAQAFAALLLCEASAKKGITQACGQCKGCELISAGTHPDFLMVEPDAPGKPIRIDRIRQVNEFARKTAQQGGRRVIIINPAQAMNINSANALLKSLEEPGSDTLFFLISARSGDMLATIRSRCQSLDFSTPPRAEGVQWLSEHVADQLVVDQLMSLTVNAPLLAYDMFDQGVLEERGKLINAMAGLFRGEQTPVELAKEWQSADLILLLDWLGSWLDDVVRFSLSADDQSIRNSDLTKMVRYLAGKSDVKNAITLRDGLIENRQLLLEGGNLNAQILLEGVFCQYLELVM